MTATQREAAHADAAFGASLHQALLRLSPKEADNAVFSPASVAAALKMALAGARGETADELAAALHLADPGAAAASLEELGTLEADGSNDLTLRTPNTMWLDETLTVREAYLEALAGSTGVERCDFAGAPGPSRERINAAVERHTEGKITNLLLPAAVTAATRLILVNAVYLNALWRHPFPAKNTKDQTFYPERMSPTPTPTMRLETRMPYHAGGGCQSVLLPYRGGNLAMAIVLPDGPLSEFVGPRAGRFDLAAELENLLRPEAERRVNLSLPRFRVESSFMLRDVLQSLGVRRAFAADAEFGGICDEPVAISDVVHKAFIDVAEEGTEAAAATAVVVQAAALRRPPEPDVTLVVDRPFLFAIADTETGLPLFQGQFTRP